MLKRPITYTDFNEVTRTEDFYFNLTEAELIEWEASEKGGMDKLIEQIIAEEDHTRLVPLFKELILKAIGKKSTDGKRFEKSPEISKEFSETLAYNVLFLELTSNAKSAADFFNSLIPKSLRDRVEEQSAN